MEKLTRQATVSLMERFILIPNKEAKMSNLGSDVIEKTIPSFPH